MYATTDTAEQFLDTARKSRTDPLADQRLIGRRSTATFAGRYMGHGDLHFMHDEVIVQGQTDKQAMVRLTRRYHPTLHQRHRMGLAITKPAFDIP
ncbi:hypothetical protein D3C81_1176790 [compost metagenome]